VQCAALFFSSEIVEDGPDRTQWQRPSNNPPARIAVPNCDGMQVPLPNKSLKIKAAPVSGGR